MKGYKNSRSILKILHSIGLTNLSDDQVNLFCKQNQEQWKSGKVFFKLRYIDVIASLLLIIFALYILFQSNNFFSQQLSYEDLEHENVVLKSENEALKKENATVSALKRENEDLKRENKTLEEKNAIVAVHMPENKDLVALKRENEDLKRENKTLKEENATLAVHMRENKDLADLKRENEKLKLENKELKKEYEAILAIKSENDVIKKKNENVVVLKGENGEKPKIGVLRFTNQVAGLYWWRSTVATELQDLLASELVSTRAFQVLERREINAVLSEQDLSASGRVSKSTLVKMRKIMGPKYLIAGTVSAFEKTSAKGGKASTKGHSLGDKKEKIYIAVDVKVIDTETGEIVDARTIEATAEDKAIGAGLMLKNFSIAGADAKKTPIGKAIRACIIKISEYLVGLASKPGK